MVFWCQIKFHWYSKLALLNYNGQTLTDIMSKVQKRARRMQNANNSPRNKAWKQPKSIINLKKNYKM